MKRRSGRPKGFKVSDETRAKISAAVTARHARERALRPPKPAPVKLPRIRRARAPMSAELRAKIRAKVLAWYADPVNRSEHRAKTVAGHEAWMATLSGPQVRKSPRPASCVYCGLSQRKKDLVPDGPGKYACADQTACEARILKQAA